MKTQTSRPTKIVLNNTSCLNKWCKILKCEEPDLVFAVMLVGNSIKMVDNFLIINNKKKD